MTAFIRRVWLQITKLVLAAIAPIIAAYSLYIVNKIHKLTNSSMTEQKRISWVSAETLAATTHDPGHIALANEAKAAYDAARSSK